MIFHNTPSKFLAVLAFFVVISLPQDVKADISQSDALKREKSLIAASTNTDSIKILLDVYNLSDKAYRNKVRQQLINLASQSNNQELIGDVINELASSTDDTGELSRLIIMSENLPADSGKESMQTVLQMEHAQSEAPTVRDSQLKEQIADFKRQGVTFTGDPYKEIQNIYRTMVYLGVSSQGPMYFECIKRLEDLVENLPEKDYAIKNLYYTNAAIFYTRKRDYEKAIEFDKKLIEQLNHMRALYQKQGKNVHDLDYFYYVSYRRMLRNFRGLTPAQIEAVYKQCEELAEINDEAKEEFENTGLAKSYYYFATGKYPQAIPELKKALAVPNISDFRKQELLGLLARAQAETGDKNGELKSLEDYVLLSIKDREKRRDDMYREMDLRNSVNLVLSDELHQQEIQRHENMVMRKTSLTLVYVLGVILIFLCGAYLRLRNKVKELQVNNNRLRKNIEYIFDDGVPKGTKDLRHQKNRLKG